MVVNCAALVGDLVTPVDVRTDRRRSGLSAIELFHSIGVPYRWLGTLTRQMSSGSLINGPKKASSSNASPRI
jgi:hypothetical protein